MPTAQLLKRNLTYYWRTNLAVLFGVATAVAVLAGALLVGDSVRTSLRDLFLLRLGRTDHVIISAGFFREQLASEIQNHDQFAPGGFAGTCPLIVLNGTIAHEPSGSLGTGIKVYGVDERFWSFHGREDHGPRNHEALLSESLARELGTRSGDSLVLRVEKPSAIPVESLHGRKEDLGRTLRLKLSETLTPSALGEFALQPQQGAVRAVFVPLGLLQKELAQTGRVNTILIAEESYAQRNREAKEGAAKLALLERILQDRASLEDFGIKLRMLPEQQSISLESDSKVINDGLAATALAKASELSLRSFPVLSYLANGIGSGDRSIPYSIVTALDEEGLEKLRRAEEKKGRRGEEAGRQGETGRPGEKTGRQGEGETGGRGERAPIILNDWAARDLGVRRGDLISLEYYLWNEGGRLETKTAQFQLADVVPIEGIAADRDLVPEYPGITETQSLSNWDPPFPIDLGRVRKQDENYWRQYRTTPKAFIPLDKGQELWQSRFGKLTSVRIVSPSGPETRKLLDVYSARLRAALDPAAMGLQIVPVRLQGLEASRGASDFGEYFLYFSFFLVVSALLLTGLFFKLGVEQRLREIGILQAVGFPASRIRGLFLGEGITLSVIGSLIGLAGALIYGKLLMLGLRTWWVGAVGTTMLTLHVSALSLMLGGVGGVFVALICVVWTLRRLGRESTRSLLTGTMGEGETGRTGDGEKGRHGEGETRSGDGEKGRKGEGEKGSRGIEESLASSPRLPVSPRLFTPSHVAFIFALLGLLLLLAAALHLIGQTAGFFGGGTMLLIALLCYQSAWLRRRSRKSIQGTGWWPVSRLGIRNATYRPGRSVLCITLIASAAFVIVAVDAFRLGDKELTRDKKSGSGGFSLLAESLLPLVHDPDTSEGREALNLEDTPELAPVTFARFRVRTGDDASCLNLYQPRNPKIIAPTNEFIRDNRFTFQGSQARTSEEKENPWLLLLNSPFADGAVPVIADANSLTYILHRKLGDEIVLNQTIGPIRLRIVGALADSIFQSELLMSERNFLRLFPEQEGYRLFLIDAPLPDQSTTIARLEDRLSDFGFDVVPASERLANFHRVQNTFLSTFQMLGGLGLILGTLGMAAVLLRNVFERRRELALLRAFGFNSWHFTLMVIAENAMLLFCGLATGTTCALLAIAPVFFARGGQLPGVSLGLLLLAVLISGLTASLIATLAVLRSPLLPALRAE